MPDFGRQRLKTIFKDLQKIILKELKNDNPDSPLRDAKRKTNQIETLEPKRTITEVKTSRDGLNGRCELEEDSANLKIKQQKPPRRKSNKRKERVK